jgi:hypothetical protein
MIILNNLVYLSYNKKKLISVMNKRELKVIAVSYSEANDGSCIVVLGDKSSKLKLPVIVNPVEAKRIVIEVERVKNKTLTIHDVMKNITDTYSVDVKEVFIHTVLAGIYYAKLITSNGDNDIEIECSTGDGIALSLVYKCPLYTTDEVVKNVGIAINEDGTPVIDGDIEEELSSESDIKGDINTVEGLNNKLRDALENEDYEEAAELRDKIEDIKS